MKRRDLIGLNILSVALLLFFSLIVINTPAVSADDPASCNPRQLPGIFWGLCYNMYHATPQEHLICDPLDPNGCGPLCIAVCHASKQSCNWSTDDTDDCVEECQNYLYQFCYT